MDYENLRQEYPETISMEQFYKIAHISKRKAKWLLENGIIPCEDSGKQTRRFRLYLADAIEFLRLCTHKHQPMGAGKADRCRAVFWQQPYL